MNPVGSNCPQVAGSSSCWVFGYSAGYVLPVYVPISWALLSSLVSAISFQVWPITVNCACAARCCLPALARFDKAVLRSLAFISAVSPVVIGLTGCHCAIE